MGRATTRTLLPLDTFARILSLNPIHFNGAVATNVSPEEVMPLQNSCADLFPQYAWQYNDRVGRDELAIEIAQAEQEVALFLGYPPAPKWVVEENLVYQRLFNRGLYGTGLDIRGRYKLMQAKNGKLLGFGRRTVSQIGSAATVTYSDADGDGLKETATFSVTTTVTDENELKVYFTGKSANPAWEIRPVRSITISGGTATIVCDSWLLIDPTLWEALPTTAGFTAIDISTDANFVTEVDVYREYIDNSVAAVTFYWGEPCSSCDGNGSCSACNTVSQNGCATIHDVKNGMVSFHPATWDADSGAWVDAEWSGGREPDRLAIWYRAGLRSDEYLEGYTNDPMPLHMARAIAYMTVSRLERDLANCSNVSNLTMWLREDLTSIGEGPKYFTQREWALNPFGTRRGEIIAWRLLRGLVERQGKAAIV